MKKLLLLILFSGLFTINSFSQNDEMKKWTDYMTPGKEQESLAGMNGNWNFTSKFWMDPAGEPQLSYGTAQCEMILGGRYSQMKVTGKMMGMDFNGLGITGFDNGKKIYLSTWVDNFGTGIMLMEGIYDESSKQLVFKGNSYDPFAGKDTEMKQTIKMIDENTFNMEMFNVVNGKDIKNMEIRYIKK